MSVLRKDDFDAIVAFFKGAAPKTAKGLDIKTAFLNWADTVTNNMLISASEDELEKAKGYRKDYAFAEEPKLAAAQAKDPQLTDEEKAYVLGMPVVNTTGMTAAQANAAVMSAKSKTPPPANSAFAVGTTTPSTTVKRALIKKGSKGEDVKAWQRILGMKDTGVFDDELVKATKKWQKGHNLTDDGKVGPLTWSKAAEVQGDTDKLISTEAQVAVATGQTAVKPAVEAAKPSQKGTVAAATTGAVTVTPATTAAQTGQSSTFAKSVNAINAQTKKEAQVVEAGMVGGLNKIPRWGWGVLIGTFAAAVGYSIFGKPKFDQRKKLSSHEK
jgi:hypothetical protein